MELPLGLAVFGSKHLALKFLLIRRPKSLFPSELYARILLLN